MRTDLTVAAVITNEKEQVVVVKQGEGSYTLPKGRVERGEKLKAALEREIYEETGISWNKVEVVKKLGNYKRYQMDDDGKDDKSVMKDIHVFLCKTDIKELIPQHEDIIEAVWVEKDKVSGLLTHEKDKEFFVSIMEMI